MNAGPLPAPADVLQAAIGGLFGVPERVVDAYVSAAERGRDPLPDLVQAWFGTFELGPLAWTAGREWLAALQALEGRAAAPPPAVAPEPPRPHLAAMPDEDSEGVPLAHYLTEPNMAVRFDCRGCHAAFDVPMAAVLAGLKARGDGDETTGIRAVGRFARKPCAKCGGRAFDTRPAWPGRAAGVMVPPPLLRKTPEEGPQGS